MQQTGDASHTHEDHGHGHDHAHGHDHGHGTGGHSHGVDVTDRNARAVLIAACLTGGFMFAEAIGGILAGSLALLADAAHMVTDTASLALAWWAFQQSKRPADARMTYGRTRLPVLVAFANAVVLLLVTAWIIVEAIERLANPTTVLAGPMLVIAALGLLVNVAAFLVLQRGGDGSLNIRSAILHVLGDLLGSVAAIVAALVIMATGWMPIDPLLSVLVALLILRSAIAVMRQSAHILLEGAPDGIERGSLAEDLVARIDGLEGIHHVHIWSLAEGRAHATLHAVVEEPEKNTEVTHAIKQRLAARFGIEHVTVEIERPGACTDPADGQGMAQAPV